MDLQGVLASIPGIGGYEASRQRNDQAAAMQLAQAHGLMGILQQAQEAANSPLRTELLKAQLAEHAQKLKQSQMLQGILGGAGGANLTNDQLDALGGVLAATGHPGAATVMGIADKRRAAADAASSAAALRSQPVGIAAGGMVPGTNQQTTQNIPPEDMQAYMRVANNPQPSSATPQAGDTSPVKGGGIFSSLAGSPYVGQQAQFLQSVVDQGKMTAKDAEAAFGRLLNLHTTQTGAANRQQITIENRPPQQPHNLQITTDEQGNQFIVNPDGSVRPLLDMSGNPMRKTTPAQIAATETKQKGKEALTNTLTMMNEQYNQLGKAGAIVDTTQGGLANAQASVRASDTGQALGRVFGTQEQAIRDKINQARPLLLNAIRQATGMSARAMDSDNELKFYLQAASDPKRSLQANRGALLMIDKMYGLGQGIPGANDAEAEALKAEYDNMASKTTEGNITPATGWTVKQRP